MEIDLALIIALLSLTVSIITFYLNQLRPPQIRLQLGPAVEIYHADRDRGSSTGFYLPVAFENRSNKNGVIVNVGLTCNRISDPSKKYFMIWREFADNRADRFAPVHPLHVPGRSTVAKVVWFMWFAESDPKLYFQQGEYLLELVYWTSNSGKAQRHSATITLPEDHAKDLEERRQSGNTLSKLLYLDKIIDYNQILDEKGVQEIISKKELV